MSTSSTKRNIGIDKDLTRAWIALSCLPGIGPVRSRQLLAKAGNIRRFWELIRRNARSSRRGSFGPGDLCLAWKKADSILADCRNSGVRAVVNTDAAFPPLLNDCPDAPLVLYANSVKPLPLRSVSDRCIAIVGTRKATSYGRMTTEQLIAGLIPYHPVVVSGLAFGIDVCAHRCCLKSGIRTEAVLAHGPDLIRPSSHYQVGKQISSEAALWSEHPPGTGVEPGSFPRRNRIIAGMVQATVVIESGLKGGSMITARLASGYNRDVMALPGTVDKPASAGCNRLIFDQTASLIRSAEDIAGLLGWKPDMGYKTEPGIALPVNENKRLICLELQSGGSMHIDDLANRCKMEISVLSAHLLELECDHILALDTGMNIRLKVNFM